MINKIYNVSGEKIKTLFIEENSLKFSSSNKDTVEDFVADLHKKLSLATTAEIKFSDIKSIKKEDSGNEIKIFYKNGVGLPVDFVFTFNDEKDLIAFLNFLKKEKKFIEDKKALTPLQANKNTVFGLIATVVMTVIFYFKALEFANEELKINERVKTKLILRILEILGVKGILAIGTIITVLLAYKIWNCYKNPPIESSYLPQKI